MESTMGSERFAVVSALDPETDAAAAHPTPDYADASKFHKFVALLMLGVPDDTETFVLSIIGYSSTAGADATTLITKSLAAHATNNDDSQHILEINGDQIERISAAAIAAGTNTNPLRYVRANVTTAVAQGETFTLVLLGFDPREGPVSGLDLASTVIGGGTVA